MCEAFLDGCLREITGCDPLGDFIHTHTIKVQAKLFKHKHNKITVQVNRRRYLTREVANSGASPLKYCHQWLTTFAYLTCTSPSCRLTLVIQWAGSRGSLLVCNYMLTGPHKCLNFRVSSYLEWITIFILLSMNLHCNMLCPLASLWLAHHEYILTQSSKRTR